jgi:hypothetical protein
MSDTSARSLEQNPTTISLLEFLPALTMDRKRPQALKNWLMYPRLYGSCPFYNAILNYAGTYKASIR